MKIVVFSGTTEGRLLSCTLADSGVQVTVCVATEYGETEQGKHPGITVRTGRLTEEEMEILLSGQDLCIDATHPYAVEVTQNIRAAAQRTGVLYKRLRRPASTLPEDCIAVENVHQAADVLRQTKGNILLTTGAKELAAFAELDTQRLFARVLPLESSLAACKAAGIMPSHIIAMQGPFGEELNTALLRQFSIRFLVTKDGGAPGGFEEKLAAARACHAQMIVICRPEDEGEPYEAVVHFCKEWMAQCR